MTDPTIAQMAHDLLSPTLEHVVSYGAAACIAWVARQLSRLMRELRAMKAGQVSSWRMQIVSACKDAERHGWMDDEERRSLGELYDAYKAADADGIIDGYMRRNAALPCVPPCRREGTD